MIDDEACGAKTLNGAYSCSVPITEHHKMHKAKDADGKVVIAWSRGASDDE
jgi:hypothetical protein